MKAYIAAPPDVLRVDEKNIREYSVLNCCGVIITTNHKTDGIYLPPDDRRHYVAWSNLTMDDFTEEYWKKTWRWYDSDGDRHVVAYLKSLDLSNFDPKAPPPKTRAFWEIVDVSRAPEDAELADVLDDMGRPNGVDGLPLTVDPPQAVVGIGVADLDVVALLQPVGDGAAIFGVVEPAPKSVGGAGDEVDQGHHGFWDRSARSRSPTCCYVTSSPPPPGWSAVSDVSGMCGQCLRVVSDVSGQPWSKRVSGVSDVSGVLIARICESGNIPRWQRIDMRKDFLSQRLGAQRIG